MTKYTDEEIIAYLKTLREGDVLMAVADSSEYYTEGNRYIVEMDDDGDLYVTDNSDNIDYVNCGDSYYIDFFEYVSDSTFEIPTSAPESFYVRIRQISEIESGGKPCKSVTVHVDDAGFAELEALESRAFDARLLSDLYGQLAGIQKKIDALEAL